MSKKTYDLQKGDGGFLAPDENVGSSIRYHFRAYKEGGRRAFHGDVTLTDCENKVCWSTWGVDKGPEHIRKKLLAAREWIDMALSALDEVEKHLAKIPIGRKKK